MKYLRHLALILTLLAIVIPALYIDVNQHVTVVGQQVNVGTNSTVVPNATTVTVTIQEIVTATIGIYHTVTVTSIITAIQGLAPNTAIPVTAFIIAISLIVGYFIGIKSTRGKPPTVKEETRRRRR